VPGTCASLGYTCGQNGDGCGGALDCGGCTAPEYCGGGGFSQCGGSLYRAADGGLKCTPKTCQDLGYDCGPAADGCGGLIQCGSCPAPEFCGGRGFNVCGTGDGGTSTDGGPACTAATCQALTFTCGPAGDGCGGLLDCGNCAAPQFCGGGGFNQCGGNTGTGADGGVLSPCVPATCQALGYTCGAAGDGCGGLLQCGTCTGSAYCGGGGFDVCGGTALGSDGGPLSPCAPATCQQLGYQCGYAGDGCGGLLDCGGCPTGQTCGAGGSFTCGTGIGPDGGPISSCTPKTCGDLGFNCGSAGDGCGGPLQCGNCTAPQFCGGGGFDRCGTGTTSDAGGSASCLNVGSACSAATQCCTGRCSGGVCAFPACTSDGQSCSGGASCCSGICTAGTCTSLNGACRTLGNACTQNTQCCSQLCSNGACAASSFCRQVGDACQSGTDCCGGICNVAAGHLYGTCGQPSTGAANCSMVDGTVCGSAGRPCPHLRRSVLQPALRALRPHGRARLPASERLPRGRRRLREELRLLRCRRTAGRLR